VKGINIERKEINYIKREELTNKRKKQMKKDRSK
jgi:hypothetical protein